MRAIPPRPWSEAGFTLVELLVVIALVAGMAALFAAGIAPGGGSGTLPTAQAAMANAIGAARAKAIASGTRVRILIHADVRDPARFRRFIALQEETSYLSDAWNPPYQQVALPEGVCILPRETRAPAGFYADDVPWTKFSSTEKLHSSALDAAAATVAVDRSAPETWDVIQFTPFGTMSTHAGDVVLTTMTRRAPGSFAAGESPVRAENPERVRGVAISTYGVPMLLDGRSSF